MANRFIIETVSKPTRWFTTGLGWVSERRAAQVFTGEQRRYQQLPNGGFWLLLNDPPIEAQRGAECPFCGLEDPWIKNGIWLHTGGVLCLAKKVEAQGSDSGVTPAIAPKGSQGAESFRISVHPNGYYQVSIPRYEGGEVVRKSDYDDALRKIETLAGALRDSAYWRPIHLFRAAVAQDAKPRDEARTKRSEKVMLERDESGNAHFHTGIPMAAFECNHVECPTWRILTNPKGRAELYGAGDGIGGVAVLWDSLDGNAPTPQAMEVMEQLQELRDAIDLLLTAVRNTQPYPNSGKGKRQRNG